MKNLPVHWYEGLFLRPHHLQAADRYWTELIQTGSRWNCAYDYGVYAFEFSKEALANHQLDVRVLKARLRDGTLVDLELGQQPDRLDLKTVDRRSLDARCRAQRGVSTRVDRSSLPGCAKTEARAKQHRDKRTGRQYALL